MSAVSKQPTRGATTALRASTFSFTACFAVWTLFAIIGVLGFFMSLGKAAVYMHIPVYYPDRIDAVGGLVGMIGGISGFILPIAFGVLDDLTGIWMSCFMLLFALVGTALLWMHLVIRRMERACFPEILSLPELPELEGMGQGHAGKS